MHYEYPILPSTIGPYQRAALERERDALLSRLHCLSQLEGARLDDIIQLIGHPEPETQKPAPRRKTA